VVTDGMDFSERIIPNWNIILWNFQMVIKIYGTIDYGTEDYGTEDYGTEDYGAED